MSGRSVTITHHAIAAVLEQHPKLTPFGYGGGGAYVCDWNGDFDVALAQRVADHLLATYPRGKRVNPRADSYGLKHVYERLTGEYIANGTLILAALLAGYTLKANNGPNPTFDMRHREVVRANTRSWGDVATGYTITETLTDEQLAGDPQREWMIDWDTGVRAGQRTVPARDAMDAIIVDGVIDVRRYYDPLDEDDPAGVFAELLVTDLRTDGAQSCIGQQFGDLLVAAPIQVHSTEPVPDCPRGFYRVTIAGEAFEGPLFDIPRSYVFS